MPLPEPWPLVDNPLAEVELLAWCIRFRRMPDGSPLYPHAPDPTPDYPGELFGHYVTAGLAFTEATGFACSVMAVSMPTFEGDD